MGEDKRQTLNVHARALCPACFASRFFYVRTVSHVLPPRFSFVILVPCSSRRWEMAGGYGSCKLARSSRCGFVQLLLNVSGATVGRRGFEGSKGVCPGHWELCRPCRLRFLPGLEMPLLCQEWTLP